MVAYNTIKETANRYKNLSELEKGYITGVMLGMMLERESREKDPENRDTGQKGA